MPERGDGRGKAATSKRRARRPFSLWRDLGDIGRGFPRDVVVPVLRDEANAGRVELADGRARIVREAFTPDVLAALAALDGG